MVTWQNLSEQAERLLWRERLALIWRLVRSLFSGQAVHQAAELPIEQAEPDGDQDCFAGLSPPTITQMEITELFGTIEYEENYDYKAQRKIL